MLIIITTVIMMIFFLFIFLPLLVLYFPMLLIKTILAPRAQTARLYQLNKKKGE